MAVRQDEEIHAQFLGRNHVPHLSVSKRHELAIRTSSTTTTAEASTFFIAEPVPIVRTGEKAHPAPTMPTSEPEVHHMADPVPPSPGKEPQRPKTRLQTGKDSRAYPDQTFSQPETPTARSEKYPVDAPSARRPLRLIGPAGQCTTSASCRRSGTMATPATPSVPRGDSE